MRKPLRITDGGCDAAQSRMSRASNRVLTRHNILTAIWGPHAEAQPEHLWVLGLSRGVGPQMAVRMV